jgi:hypothetical protein
MTKEDMYFQETEADLRKWETQVKKLESRQTQNQSKDENSPITMIEQQEVLIDQKKHDLGQLDEAWQEIYTSISETLAVLEQSLEQAKEIVQEEVKDDSSG